MDLQVRKDTKWDRDKANPFQLKCIFSLTPGEGVNHEWHHGAVQLWQVGV